MKLVNFVARTSVGDEVYDTAIKAYDLDNGLWVHRDVRDEWCDCWCVSHHAGLIVSYQFKFATRREAIAYAKELEGMFDWTKSEKELVAEAHAADFKFTDLRAAYERSREVSNNE